MEGPTSPAIRSDTATRKRRLRTIHLFGFRHEQVLYFEFLVRSLRRVFDSFHGPLHPPRPDASGAVDALCPTTSRFFPPHLRNGGATGSFGGDVVPEPAEARSLPQWRELNVVAVLRRFVWRPRGSCMIERGLSISIAL